MLAITCIGVHMLIIDIEVSKQENHRLVRTISDTINELPTHTSSHEVLPETL